MEIKVCCKSVGKKNNSVQKISYEYSNSMSTVKDFITETVKINVEDYKQRQAASEVIQVLSKSEVEDQSTSGKISFGCMDTTREPNLLEAIDNALECFEDGIVVLFLDGVQAMRLEDTISLHEGSEAIFVRMTMLVGRMW